MCFARIREIVCDVLHSGSGTLMTVCLLRSSVDPLERSAVTVYWFLSSEVCILRLRSILEEGNLC
jgi:hypothetical protein